MASLWGCGTAAHSPRIPLEFHSLRLPAVVDEDATVDLSAYSPIAGRLSLSPILAEEGLASPMPGGEVPVQIVVHYGRFYLIGDGFHSLWELTPVAGTDEAHYRSIRVLAASNPSGMNGVKLSRFRNLDTVCIRLDQANHAPLFLARDGAFNETCQ